MTKIFITIPWFLPAFRAGGPIQSIANLVKELSNDFEFYIFCSDTDLNGAAIEVQTNSWLNYSQNVKVYYAAPPKISDALVKEAERIKPEIVYIVGLFSWHFNIVPLLFIKGTRKILSARGMLHPGALTQKKWKKKIFLHLFKLFEYHYKVHFHATDQEEADYIQNFFGEKINVGVASNFPNKIGRLNCFIKKPGELNLLSIGIISPMKSFLEILEALKGITGRVYYQIFGAVKDENYRDQLLEKIKELPENIHVELHREIEPSLVKEKLAQAQVFVLPSKSENFGHAIYEALSAGRPVITSYHTPWQNLREAHAGMNVSIIPESFELRSALDYFVKMDQEKYSRWSEGALQYASDSIDFAKIKSDYLELFSMESK